MLVHINFASAYASILGQNNVDLKIEADQATVDEVVACLLRQYPHWEVLLENNNYCENGKLKAMYVSEQDILNGDFKLTDGAHIRILIPICGG